jgi:hypothetical protein
MGSSKAKKEARKTLDKEAIVSKLAENFGRSVRSFKSLLVATRTFLHMILSQFSRSSKP